MEIGNNAIDIVNVLKRISKLVDDYEDLQEYDTIYYPFFDSALESVAEPTVYMVNNILEVMAILDFIESPIFETGKLVFDDESEKYTIDGTHYIVNYNHIIEFWDTDSKSYKLARVAYHIKHRYVAVTLDNVPRMILLDGLKVRYRGVSKIKNVMCTSFLPTIGNKENGEEN
ncbi:hypothetical protein [Rummeliibacillus suwonensis]|uniref:hypothetical protein n=1 Tax=Rummeliibacillus suwonensis TaxID=1306154 RepID=UPI0028A1BEF5|nr:hypothetical protein [Rummeliibacillus suwonensis]